jgi:hypothetical protein
VGTFLIMAVVVVLEVLFAAEACRCSPPGKFD